MQDDRKPPARAARAGAGFTSRRGRPTADQAEAISRAIMTAATECFLAEGYDGASMDAIGARAGVPKSTLYKRYPDKRALLHAVLAEQRAAWTLPDTEDFLGDQLEARLKSFAEAMMARALSPELRAMFGLITSAWSEPQAARDLLGYSGMLDRLEREIREYGPRSGVAAKDPRRPASALMAMLQGWLQWEAPLEPDVNQAAVRFAHAAVELLMKGSAAW